MTAGDETSSERAAPSAAPGPAADASPDYVSEAWGEVRSFLSTLSGTLARPGSFARDWAAGRREAMNPLAFFGVCLALTTGASTVRGHLVGEPDPQGAWLADLLGQNLYLAGFVLYGLVVQWWLRRRGLRLSRRAVVGLVLLSMGATNRSLGLVAEAVLTPVWMLVGVPVLTAAGFLALAAIVVLAVTWARGPDEAQAKARARRALTRPAQAEWDRANPRPKAPKNEEADLVARRALVRPAAQAAWDREHARPADPKAAAPPAAGHPPVPGELPAGAAADPAAADSPRPAGPSGGAPSR